MRAVDLSLVALLFFGCGPYDSPVFTPKDGDPAYPCAKSEYGVDGVSCRPFDGSRECCPSGTVCVDRSVDISGCKQVANPDPIDPGFFNARIRPVRVPERP